MKHPEFPLSDELIYLNHAAVAPWPKRTSEAVIRFAEQNSRYGSHFYPDWLRKEAELRRQFQALLNAPSGDRKSNRMSTSMAHVWGVSGMHTGDCWVDFSKPVARDFSV